MANLVYIQIISGQKNTKEVPNSKSTSSSFSNLKSNDIMVFPLIEDLKLDVSSGMGKFSDMLGGLNTLIQNAQNIIGGISGSTSAGLTDLGNMFNVPRWTHTNPIGITGLKLPFYCIEDGYKDVVEPMKKIMSLTILSVDPANKNKFIIPGISATSLKVTTRNSNKPDANNSISTSAKLVSVKIPGIIYLKVAMILRASPTYSKHLTKSGYPLWGELDCDIISLYPALDEMFARKE